MQCRSEQHKSFNNQLTSIKHPGQRLNAAERREVASRGKCLLAVYLSVRLSESVLGRTFVARRTKSENMGSVCMLQHR